MSADSFDGKASVLVHGKSTSSPESSTNAARVDGSGNFVVTLGTQIAGEFNVGNAASSYIRAVGRANGTIVNTTSQITIGGGAASDTMLRRVVATKTTAGTISITGFQDQSASAATLVFPAALPAGSYDMGDAVNSAGALKVTLGDTSDVSRVIISWLPT